MIVRPGLLPARRRPRSLRCFRFSPPRLNRSKVDIFLFVFAMSYSCGLKSDPGSACENLQLSNEVVPDILQGRHGTNQCIAAARSCCYTATQAPILYRP